VLLALKSAPKTTSPPVLPGHSASAGNAGSNPTSGAPLYPEHPSESNSLLLLGRALKREPQNPLLLLAKATTYPPNSANYDQFKQQGFEIARRLQDAKHCKPSKRRSIPQCSDDARVSPDPKALDTFDMEDMDELLENMLHKMFGGKIPERTETNASQLKQMMSSIDFGEEEDFLASVSRLGSYHSLNRPQNGDAGKRKSTI